MQGATPPFPPGIFPKGPQRTSPFPGAQKGGQSIQPGPPPPSPPKQTFPGTRIILGGWAAFAARYVYRDRGQDDDPLLTTLLQPSDFISNTNPKLHCQNTWWR